jgi:hypothetical protein
MPGNEIREYSHSNRIFIRRPKGTAVSEGTWAVPHTLNTHPEFDDVGGSEAVGNSDSFQPILGS